MSKVYVLSDDGHDLSNANEFGEITFVKEGRYTIFNPSTVILELEKILKEYKDGIDYLIISGSPFVMGLAMSLLFMKGIKQLNVLIFDAKKRQYFPRTVSTNQLN